MSDDTPIEIPGQLTSVEVGPDRIGQLVDIIQALALVAIAIALWVIA